MKKIIPILILVFAISASAESNYTLTSDLKTTLTSISHAAYGPWRYDRTFRAGETAYVNISVEGFQADENNRFWIQADLRAPQLGVNSPNIINGSIKAMNKVPMNFKFKINTVRRGGRVNVLIKVRDVVSRKYVIIREWFAVSR